MKQSALILVGEGHGNIIMATPLIQAVHELGYATHVFVRGNYGDASSLLTGWPIIENVWTSMGDVRAIEWDALVGSAWLRNDRLIPAKRRVSPAPADMREVHESVVNLSAAVKLGWAGHPPPPHCEAGDVRTPLPEKFIACCPGWGGRVLADWARKAWGGWNSFVKNNNSSCVFLGSEADEGLCSPNASAQVLGRPIREVAGILKKAECVVAVDNGLAHVAAALGARTVVLFGATSEAKNRPLGRDVTVLSARYLPCRPCQMTDRWNECADWQCMERISVEQVLEAIQ